MTLPSSVLPIVLPIRGVDGRAACLSVLDGELVVEVGDFGQTPRAGEPLRHRWDQPHRIRNLRSASGHATMVCILKAAVVEWRLRRGGRAKAAE